MRKRDRESLKKLLTEQRDELRGNAKKTRSEDIHVDPDDFPDEIDIASSEVNLQFAGRLREREHGLLAKIDAALLKIQSGEYGECVNCGEQIGVASGSEYECLASAAWVDDKTLNMEVLITDIHLGGLRMSIAFDDDRIGVYITKQAEWFLDEYVGFAGGKVG